MKKLFSLVTIFSVCACAMFAQVSSSPSPIPVGHKGQIVLTFDPTLGTGGMAKATECYSHIGLITSKSKDITDWQYIKSGKNNWGTTKEPQWTKVENKWQLTIDNMYSFFGCPESETISYIVMVFHNGKGSSSLQGKSSTTSNGDILVGIGQEVQDDIWKGFTPAACQQEKRPNGVENGIYYGTDGTSVTLCTYAASKSAPAQHVFLLGDMTNWKLSNDYQLKRDGNYFWIQLTGLEKGKEYRYQYAIVRDDGVKKQISDLFSEKVLTPDDQGEPKTVDPTLIGYPIVGASGYVTVIQPGKPSYAWSDATLNFKRPNKNNLVIYELWVYDHTAKRSLVGMMERLDYLKDLGVNCVELMPVNEFDGNQSWGYSPNHYFAFDKAYGKPEHLKAFVDECHKRGMAVVLDMVFNHATGNNPMNKLYPWTSSVKATSDLSKNPWFNFSAPHKDNVYEDWNHGFAPAQDMFRRALQYWLKEYKIDGYRMDLSHGLCDTVANTSVKHIKDYYENGVKAVAADAYFMLEHWGDNMSSERPQLVNAGMMCWENTCNAFEQVTMGWLKDGDDLGGANNDNYVSYSENHDEERCFFKAKQWGNGSGSKTMQNDEETRANRIPLVLGMQVMMNGPQLFYHFAEIGYDNSKFQDSQGRWGKDGISAYGKISTDTVGWEVKMSTKKSAVNVGWFQPGPRMRAWQRLAQIIQLRTRLMPTTFEGNPTSSKLNAGASLRYVQWGSDVVAVGNFSATGSQTYNLPSGTWYDYLDGGAKASASCTLQAGEIKVFTGKYVAAPSVPDHYDFELFTGWEDTAYYWPENNRSTMKIMQNGRLYICMPDGTKYDVLGRSIR